jgi:hypothetical protein
MQFMISALFKKQYKLFLIGIPTSNLISYPILLLLHWTSGKYGYQIATAFTIFSTFLLLLLIEAIKRFKSNNNFTPLFFIIIFYCILFYHNSKIAIQAYLNNGWIPCELGVSCP